MTQRERDYEEFAARHAYSCPAAHADYDGDIWPEAEPEDEEDEEARDA